MGGVEDCNGVLDGDAVEDQCGVCDNDATNDCAQDCEGHWGGEAVDCGNVTIWVTCDENFEEVRWRLLDSGDSILDDGAPAEPNAYLALGFTLEPGEYHFEIVDSGDNGGCATEIRVDETTVGGWAADGYEGHAAVPFYVPEPVVDDGADDTGTDGGEGDGSSDPVD